MIRKAFSLNTKKKARDVLKMLGVNPEVPASLVLDDLGSVHNLKQEVNIELDHDPMNSLGLKGLPTHWEDMLRDVGISTGDISAHYEEAMELVSLHIVGDLEKLLNHKRLDGKKTMERVMKKAVKIKTTDPNQVYKVNYEKDRLGGGAFGDVFSCVKKSSGKKYAMKRTGVEKKKLIEKEIRMHALSQGHKNVVGFLEAFEFRNRIYLIVELMNLGSLYDYVYGLPQRMHWKEKALLYVMKKMLKGLAFMHSQNHLHRDIKSQNVLLNDKGEVKLADFGFAVGLNKKEQKRKTVLGTPYWMAPEMLAKKAYDCKVDVWSTGITAYEIAENQPPHMGLPFLKVLFEIKTKPAPRLTDERYWSKDFIHFLSLCLKKDPGIRASAAELLMHPALSKEKICKTRSFTAMLEDIMKIKKELEKEQKAV